MAKKIDVDEFVAQPALALVGVSRTGKKFSNATMKELRAKGYKVYPVNRNGGEVEGEKIYSRLQDLPEKVGGVLIMVKPAEAEAAVREAADCGIRRAWLQQGSETPAALKAASDHDMQVISGECILMFAGKSGFHGFHKFVNKLIGRLPA
jgi:predicted CoA-binding protein